MYEMVSPVKLCTKVDKEKGKKKEMGSKVCIGKMFKETP